MVVLVVITLAASILIKESSLQSIVHFVDDIVQLQPHFVFYIFKEFLHVFELLCLDELKLV